MKARKLNLVEYEVNGKPYDIKLTLRAVIFHPERRLNSLGLVKAMDLWRKIEPAAGKVLLSQEEWGELETAFQTVKGFSSGDYELVCRVKDAPEVEVGEQE